MNTPLRASYKDKSKKRDRQSPYGDRRSSSGCYAPFKSPFSSKKSSPSTLSLCDKKILTEEVSNLRRQVDERDKEIEELSKTYSENEAQDHIEKLHEYNELKDIAQMVMGQLAEINGTTTKEMYIKFGLDMGD